MTNSSMQQELDEIKAQLEQMKAQKRAAQQPPPQTQSESAQQESDKSARADTGQSDNDKQTSSVEGEHEQHDSVAEQLKELVETIETELDSSSPTALIAVFALGVLVGRLLPR